MHHAYHCLALTFWRIWRGKQLKAVRKHCSHLAAITFRTILLYASVYINPIPPMEPSRNASHYLLLGPNHYPLHTISRKSTPFSASFLAAPPCYQLPAPPPRSLAAGHDEVEKRAALSPALPMASPLDSTSWARIYTMKTASNAFT